MGTVACPHFGLKVGGELRQIYRKGVLSVAVAALMCKNQVEQVRRSSPAHRDDVVATSLAYLARLRAQPANSAIAIPEPPERLIRAQGSSRGAEGSPATSATLALRSHVTGLSSCECED